MHDADVPPRIVIDGTEDAAQARLRMTCQRQRSGRRACGAAPRFSRPFFTTKARGTGLGLALVQKIIVTHNGRVTAANADGGGARLTVSLPLRTA